MLRAGKLRFITLTPQLTIITSQATIITTTPTMILTMSITTTTITTDIITTKELFRIKSSQLNKDNCLPLLMSKASKEPDQMGETNVIRDFNSI